MEDDGGVKAPVTRLRRRLSVEQSDDGKPSSAPGTPTKKRGGRKPAKPELDLIDENAPVNDTLKKANIKDLDVEDKPVTPSRRSTRIKSNTSIVLETTQAVESPRAKRASRRNSQIGSDNETPVTPARLTRRTRRDSATDKAESVPSTKPVGQTTEIIIEEPETLTQKTSGNSEKPTEQRPSSGLRKSPRLSLKKNQRSDSTSQDIVETSKTEDFNINNKDSVEANNKETDESEKYNKSNIKNKTSQGNITPENVLPIIKLVDINSDLNKEENNRLSMSNLELLDKVNTMPMKKNKILNKSSSALPDNDNQHFKHKRHRTKSWTTLSDSIKIDNKCYSDSENSKKEKKKKNLLDSANTGDANNIFKSVNDNLNLTTKKQVKEVPDITVKGVETELIISTDNKEKLSPNTHTSVSSINTNLFDKEPSNDIQAIVYIDDSDSNSDQKNTQKQVEAKNRSLSVVQKHSQSQEIASENEKIQNVINLNQSSEEKKVDLNKNDSCEPMDVDETLPDNNTLSNKSLSMITDRSENKVSLNMTDKMNSLNEADKSKKLSAALSISQALDKTTIENKSTLVLSQLKDISNDNLSHSLHSATENKLSNSDQALNFTQDNEVDKKNHSINCLTSTPLQHKSLIKHTIQVNTPTIDSNNTSKTDKSYTKINVSNTNKVNNNSENSESDDETSQEENNFIDDEAEEANDDYESGDSRDDEEKQYEREHEIKEKGHTLTSEEEMSYDTDEDYEKDSFVVSSDEEDGDLLDGSGDDLSMTDNELKMTAESKKKYNERKTKEQKNASKEMFVSRHKLNISDKSNKSGVTKQKRIRAIIDSDSEDETINIKVKKNNRIRLDSSHEISTNKSSENISNSLHDDNDTNEAEMSIVEEQKESDKDPLLMDIKQEPTTPHKGTINSSIQYIDPEQTGKDAVDNNKSQSNKTLVDDPLEESNVSESSDSSNNVHIKNYDSILNDLNKNITNKKNKKVDISLNIDKKVKKKSAPIVDQLNLTQIKTKGKKQNEVTLKKSKKSLDIESKKESSENCDNDSSVSIDLHLLFSEDSNNSEDVEVKEKKIETEVKEKQTVEDDNFIPLKKNHDRSYVSDTSDSKNKSLTDSAKKLKKKSKAMDKSDIENNVPVDETEVQFLVDKTGTHSPATEEKSINRSATKKKKEKFIASENKDSDSDAPMEMSNKNFEGQQIDVDEVDNTSLAANKSLTKTPKSAKKKKRMSESQTKENTDAAGNNYDTENDFGAIISQSGLEDTLINKSVSRTPKSDKKKSKRLSESHTAENKDVNSDSAMELSNKDVTETQNQHVHEKVNVSLEPLNKSLTKTPKSEKKKKRISESQGNEQTDTPEVEPVTEDDIATKINNSDAANKSMNKSVTKTPKSEKKKAKRMSESLPVEESVPEDNIINKSVIKTPKSDKKKKKLSESQLETLTPSTSISTLDKTSSSEKKKAKKILESNNENIMENVAENTEAVGSKKRKRKSSLNQTEHELQPQGHVPHPTSTPNTTVADGIMSQNKKRKVSHTIEKSENSSENNIVAAPITNKKLTEIEKQKNQIMEKKHPLQIQVNNKQDTTDESLPSKKGVKKRKQREDDAEIQMAKMLKADTNGKIQVSRLPTRILDQLEDKPTKTATSVTKPKAISTSNFVVEETRVKKTKPSNYLEESIYLNEDEVLESKKQRHIRNPKVLPFLPTVSTSSSGYTTNFKVNILPKEIKFVAKSANVNNYKNDYLQNKKMKRLGTYELYKRNRTIKMSKF